MLQVVTLSDDLAVTHIGADAVRRDTLYLDVRSPPTPRILFLSPLVLSVVGKDTSRHHVRRTKQKASIQTEAVVSCVVILRILQRIVHYEREVSFYLYTGFAANLYLLFAGTTELEGSAVLGTGREVGADEDDFHVLKRNTKELDRGDRMEERMRRLLRTKAGVISNNVKPGAVPKPSVKKVVYF